MESSSSTVDWSLYCVVRFKVRIIMDDLDPVGTQYVLKPMGFECTLYVA